MIGLQNAFRLHSLFAVSLALRSHLLLCVIHIQSSSCTSHIFSKLEVYVCIYMCSKVLCLFCILVYVCVKVCILYVYVCVSVCVVWAHSSATERCYVLLLLSRCHRNIVVAKLLLPRYLISCSSELSPVLPHITHLPPTGCWQYCSKLVKLITTVARNYNKKIPHPASR